MVSTPLLKVCVCVHPAQQLSGCAQKLCWVHSSLVIYRSCFHFVVCANKNMLLLQPQGDMLDHFPYSEKSLYIDVERHTSGTVSHHHLCRTCPPTPERESCVCDNETCDTTKALLLTGPEGCYWWLNQNIWMYLHWLTGQHEGNWTNSAVTWCGPQDPKQQLPHCEEQHGEKDPSAPAVTAVRAELLCCGREWPLSVQLSTHHTRHWIMLQKWSSQRQAHPPRDEEWRSADRTACELSAKDIMTTPLGSLPYICLLRKTTRRVIQLCCSHDVSIQILPDFWRSQKFSLNINRQTDTAQWKRIFPFCQRSEKSARLIV